MVLWFCRARLLGQFAGIFDAPAGAAFDFSGWDAKMQRRLSGKCRWNSWKTGGQTGNTVCHERARCPKLSHFEDFLELGQVAAAVAGDERHILQPHASAETRVV